MSTTGTCSNKPPSQSPNQPSLAGFSAADIQVSDLTWCNNVDSWDWNWTSIEYSVVDLLSLPYQE